MVCFSINGEVFDIGAVYTSMMAARRESGVLLTEGHDAAFAFPGRGMRIPMLFTSNTGTRRASPSMS